MNYFHLQNRKKKKSPGQDFSLLRVFKWFAPFFLIAFFLPFLLANTYQNSRADADELRVWLEPETITLEAGQSVELTVVADFENSALLSDLTITLDAPSGLTITPTALSYNRPFRGRTSIGTVRVQGSPGTYLLKPIQATSTLSPSLTTIMGETKVTIE